MIMVSYKQFQLYLANKQFFCNKIKLVSLKKVADPDEKFYNLIIHICINKLYFAKLPGKKCYHQVTYFIIRFRKHMTQPENMYFLLSNH